MISTLHLLGYASGIAAASNGCAEAPFVLQRSLYLAALSNQGINLHWEDILTPSTEVLSTPDKIIQLSQSLAKRVNQLAMEKKFFTVFGGDHSCAIGTWSGASSALEKGSMGLIWIDAHMDAHTPETTGSGNVHGMPVACLLGYGNPKLTQIMTDHPKIDPNNLCLIGIRSFESGEAELLQRLNVRVVMMDEVKKRGLDVIMREAIHIASDKTTAFGVSIDIDGIDPQDAPGTGMRESDGIRAQELCEALTLMAQHPKLMGLEIAEFDPSNDAGQVTEQLIAQLILSIVHGKTVL